MSVTKHTSFQRCKIYHDLKKIVQSAGLLSRTKSSEGDEKFRFLYFSTLGLSGSLTSSRLTPTPFVLFSNTVMVTILTSTLSRLESDFILLKALSANDFQHNDMTTFSITTFCTTTFYSTVKHNDVHYSALSNLLLIWTKYILLSVAFCWVHFCRYQDLTIILYLWKKSIFWKDVDTIRSNKKSYLEGSRNSN